VFESSEKMWNFVRNYLQTLDSAVSLGRANHAESVTVRVSRARKTIHKFECVPFSQGQARQVITEFFNKYEESNRLQELEGLSPEDFRDDDYFERPEHLPCFS
jgi:hypothetical protein